MKLRKAVKTQMNTDGHGLRKTCSDGRLLGFRISGFGLRASGSRGGHSVMEMLVATSVAGLVFGAVATLFMFSARSFVALGNYGDLDAASRNALDTMSRDIRQTHALTNFTSTRLIFEDFDMNALTFVYDSGARTLTKQKGGASTVLLQQCDYLNFDISQRNPSSNFTFVATANLLEVKLIDVSWRCSRQIMGSKVNTESVQTAKIVIRN